MFISLHWFSAYTKYIQIHLSTYTQIYFVCDQEQSKFLQPGFLYLAAGSFTFSRTDCEGQRYITERYLKRGDFQWVTGIARCEQVFLIMNKPGYVQCLPCIYWCKWDLNQASELINLFILTRQETPVVSFHVRDVIYWILAKLLHGNLDIVYWRQPSAFTQYD